MKCRSCSNEATNGVYCKYHRDLYNERVLALRAKRKEAGKCIMCAAPRSPESETYCVIHMRKEAKRHERSDIKINGTLKHLLKKNRIDKADLHSIKNYFAIASNDPGFRANLNEQEQWILDNRVLSDSPLSLRNAGQKLGVSHEWIRKVENVLAEKFRTWLLKLNYITVHGKIIPRS